MLLVSALAACGRSRQQANAAGQPADSGLAFLSTPPQPARVKTALDSGNALYRKKDYAGALAQYRIAANVSGRDPAPFYGIAMVAQVTSNTALYDSALTAMRARGYGDEPGDHSANPATDAPVKATEKAPAKAPAKSK